MVESGLPAPFVERLNRIVAAEDRAMVLDSFAATKPLYARLNPLRHPIEQTFDELTAEGFEPRRVPGTTTAVRFDPACRDALMRCSAVNLGRLYPQSLSSQCAAPLLSPAADHWILDLAAAPGGKTLHLAALMNNQGKISAVEAIRTRMFRLAENLKRAGVTNTKTYLMDGRAVARKTPDRFDRVLLDAPCSSESRRRVDDPETTRYWSPRKITEQARKQQGLLQAALQACRPGGLVLYATCSLAPEENERIVASALQRSELTVEVQTLDDDLFPTEGIERRAGLTEWEGETFPQTLAQTCRILPTDRCDAFYLALLKRVE